jgi:hypothetical protein
MSEVKENQTPIWARFAICRNSAASECAKAGLLIALGRALNLGGVDDTDFCVARHSWDHRGGGTISIDPCILRVRSIALPGPGWWRKITADPFRWLLLGIGLRSLIRHPEALGATRRATASRLSRLAHFRIPPRVNPRWVGDGPDPGRILRGSLAYAPSHLRMTELTTQ